MLLEPYTPKHNQKIRCNLKPVLKYDVRCIGTLTDKSFLNYLLPVEERIITILSEYFQPIYDKRSPSLILLIYGYSFGGRYLLRQIELIKLLLSVSKSALVFHSRESSKNTLHSLFKADQLVFTSFKALFGSTIMHIEPGKKNILPLLFQQKKYSGGSVNTRKTRFCNFIYRNDYNKGARLRKKFCQQLMEYKHVDCPSYILHNLNIKLPDNRKKVEFMSNYKFSICFENDPLPWYVTEKIVHAYHARSVPIYWGCPQIKQIFNPKSFINVSDFSNWDACIDYIKQVDQDPSLYEAYLAENPYSNLNDVLNPDFKLEKLEKQFLTMTQAAVMHNTPGIKTLRLFRVLTSLVLIYVPLTLKQTGYWLYFKLREIFNK